MLFAILLAAQAAAPVEAPTQSSSAAPAPQTGQPPKFKGMNGGLDYPMSALRKGQEGVVFYQVSVRADGKPVACTITESSGTPELDKATCRQARESMIFEPAQDAQGLPVKGTYLGRLVWSVPKPAPQQR